LTLNKTAEAIIVAQKVISKSGADYSDYSLDYSDYSFA